MITMTKIIINIIIIYCQCSILTYRRTSLDILRRPGRRIRVRQIVQSALAQTTDTDIDVSENASYYIKYVNNIQRE